MKRLLSSAIIMGSVPSKKISDDEVEPEPRGDRYRRFNVRSTTEDVLKDIDLAGKTVLITGTSSGIGREIARALASHGAHVVMANRNIPESEKLRDEILSTKPDGKVDILPVDLSSLINVKAAAYEFLSKGWPLHILILNAGVLSPLIKSTVDSIETCFAINHVAHFYLTQLLIAKLRESAPSRVVVVTSNSHAYTKISPSLSVDEKMQILVPTARAKEPKPALFYSYSKLCNVLFAFALHRREHNNGINTYAVHPGTMTGTGILRHQGAIGKAMNFVAKPWGKTLKQGAATVVYCAADPELSNISGRYFESCWDDEKYHEVALTRDEALQDALWQHTEKLLDKFSVHGE